MHVSLSLRSYLQYSAICARLLRQALKPEFKANALKNEESNLKVSKWKNGEPGKSGVLVSGSHVLITIIARFCNSQNPLPRQHSTLCLSVLQHTPYILYTFELKTKSFAVLCPTF